MHGHYGRMNCSGPVFIRSLSFESNKKKYGPYGREEGTYFSIPTSGALIAGFHGTSGCYLDSIGVYLRPIQDQKNLKTNTVRTQIIICGGDDNAIGCQVQVATECLGNNCEVAVSINQHHDSATEREEETRKPKVQKISEEAEQKRLQAEAEERRKQRILREIEERELVEAQALLEETEKHYKKGKGKKSLMEGEKLSKETLMHRAPTEQMKERQEMEKKLQKLAKTMDYLERGKREEAAPLIEAAFQQRIVEERALHEPEEQQEIEISRLRHDGDLQEKNRLSRMLENKNIFRETVMSCRQAEFDRRNSEREERINQIIQARKKAREEKRKIIYYVNTEEEAFRSVEDIHGLMCLVKKTPKASLMVVYYAKLTEIFWISSSHLYHAYAWIKLFTLQKSFNKNLSQKDLQLIASSVVLAALSVAPYSRTHASHVELENEKERNLRMANLIGFNLDPKPENRETLSRSSLLSELVSIGVLSCATLEVKDIYHLLEHEFLPLDFASKIQPLLTKISKLGGKLVSASSLPEVQLLQYVPALEKLATLRVLQQVSQVYHTISIEGLSKMVPFFDFSVVEKISVDAVKQNFIAMKIDHMKGVVLFGSLGLESDGLRDHLAVLAESLNKARAMLFPPAKKESKHVEMLPSLSDTVDKEHKRLVARKSIIEKRKEEQERHLLEKEREVEARKLKVQKISEEAEQKRLQAEAEERRNQRILREIEERELVEAQALLEETEKLYKKGKGKGKKPLMEGEKLTKETLMHRALTEQMKERQEMEKKLQKLAKTMVYLERAKREEAAPLIEAAFQQQIVEERALHEPEEQQEIEISRLRHDGNLQEKNRLSRMLENKNIFRETVMSRRQAEFDRRNSEREERINQIIQARKKAREERRKIIYYVNIEEERLRKRRRDAGEKRPSARPNFIFAAAAAVSSTGKYVPKFCRADTSQAPPPSQAADRWGSSGGGGGQKGSSWRADDRKTTSFGGSSRFTWSSSSRC